MLIPEELLPPPHKSWNQVLAGMPDEARENIIAALSDDDAVSASEDWFLQARREQMPPGWLWTFWLIMAGRGFGKTWGGAHWLINEITEGNGTHSGIIAATAEDLRRYCIEGPSGIMSLAPSWFYPEYQPSKTQIVWPDGSVTLLFTSEKPERLRGPNLDKVWCDELASWKKLDETWNMLQFCLRRGENPQALITTTPRPKKVIRELVSRKDSNVAITVGPMHDNAANLSPDFIKTVEAQFKGTKLERQEIYGDLLDEFEGALWNYTLLDQTRVKEAPHFLRKGVGVDPAISSAEGADLTGIISGGLSINKEGFVTGDYSLRASPETWARKAVGVYHQTSADFLVAEKNQGGEMVEATIKAVDESVNVILVHASKGKITRAEPIAAYYEQSRCHHVGTFPDLEDEMCMFLPGELKKSPDRTDALVWLMSQLMGGANMVAPRIRSV